MEIPSRMEEQHQNKDVCDGNPQQQQHHEQEKRYSVQSNRTVHVVVIVLGDVGRSPRMQYHAVSLLEAGFNVTLVGYIGEEVIPALKKRLDASKCQSITDSESKGTEMFKCDSRHKNNSPEQFVQPSPSFHMIRFRPWTTPLKILESIRVFYFAFRIVSLTLQLSWILLVSISRPITTSWSKRRPSPQHPPPTIDCILVQNPPAIPLLITVYAFVQMIALWRRISQFVFLGRNHTITAKRPAVVIDWHNLGYSLLGGGSRLQRVAKLYEERMATLADGHLAVTQAMKQFVESNMLFRPPTIQSLQQQDCSNSDAANTNSNINMDVLYDCPPSLFRPLSIKDQHELLLTLDQQLRERIPNSWYPPSTMLNEEDERHCTLFTERFVKETCHNDSDSDITNTSFVSVHYDYRPRMGRPALITSSTSWTEDEDFGILLKALELLDNQITQATPSDVRASHALKVVVIVTGKGPQKQMYLERISRLSLQHVTIHTAWLAPQDYPKLIACADVGVSLHTSSSGIDLPMKILDLYGCHVPVCAYRYDCLSRELVLDHMNGRTFTTEKELSEQLYELLSPLASHSSIASSPMANHDFGLLKQYSTALIGRTRWSENWNQHALPVIQRAMATTQK